MLKMHRKCGLPIALTGEFLTGVCECDETPSHEDAADMSAEAWTRVREDQDRRWQCPKCRKPFRGRLLRVGGVKQCSTCASRKPVLR